MTYKKIVEGMVARSARGWLEGLLKNSDIDAWVFLEDVEIEKDPKAPFWKLWKATFKIHKKESYYTWLVTVGGTVDDSGVSNSVIWLHDGDNKKEIWFSVKETRIFFGISEFKLP